MLTTWLVELSAAVSQTVFTFHGGQSLPPFERACGILKRRLDYHRLVLEPITFSYLLVVKSLSGTGVSRSRHRIHLLKSLSCITCKSYLVAWW